VGRFEEALPKVTIIIIAHLVSVLIMTLEKDRGLLRLSTKEKTL